MGCTASKSAGFTPRLPLETQPHPPSAFGHHVPVLLEPEKNASPFLVTKLSQEAGFGTVADGPAVVSSSTVNTTPKELEVSGVAPHAEDAKNAVCFCCNLMIQQSFWFFFNFYLAFFPYHERSVHKEA